MAEETTPEGTESSPAPEAVIDADDSGVTTESGGTMDYAALNDSINAAVGGHYEFELDKQERLGSNPCAFWVAMFQRWDMEARHPLWKVETLAARISEKLQLAIGDSFMEQGEPSPDYVGGQPAAVWLLDKIGPQDLIPQSLLGLSAFATFLSGGVGAAGAPGAMLMYISSHLPNPNKILEGKVPTNAKGLEVSSGVSIWGSGCSSNPTSQADKDKCRDHGTYRGTRIAEALADWANYQQQNVSPPNFSSARARLTNVVGRWEGTGDFGIWKTGNSVSANSRLGSLYDLERMYKDGIAEGRAACDAMAEDRSKLLWTKEYRNWFLIGLAALVGWRASK